MVYGETFLRNFKFYAKTLTKLHDLTVPVLRIRDVYTGSQYFPSRIRIRIKDLNILTPKIVFKLSEIWSKMFIPDLDFLPIPNPDPQHCQKQNIASSYYIDVGPEPFSDLVWSSFVGEQDAFGYFQVSRIC
jgi:hypothetical protein